MTHDVKDTCLNYPHCPIGIHYSPSCSERPNQCLWDSSPLIIRSRRYQGLAVKRMKLEADHSPASLPRSRMRGAFTT